MDGSRGVRMICMEYEILPISRMQVLIAKMCGYFAASFLK